MAQSLADRHLWRRPPTGDHMTHQLDGLRLCFGQPNAVRSSPKPPHRFRSYRKHLELHSGQTLQEPHASQTRPLPQTDEGYTDRMIAVIVVIVVALAIGALLWWGSTLPPTRPRPDSRYRGRTFMSVHRRLQRRPRGR